MSTKPETIKAAIHMAILRSIHKMGLAEFKKTSFFGSSHEQSAHEIERTKDAA